MSWWKRFQACDHFISEKFFRFLKRAHDFSFVKKHRFEKERERRVEKKKKKKRRRKNSWKGEKRTQERNKRNNKKKEKKNAPSFSLLFFCFCFELGGCLFGGVRRVWSLVFLIITTLLNSGLIRLKHFLSLVVFDILFSNMDEKLSPGLSPKVYSPRVGIPKGKAPRARKNEEDIMFVPLEQSQERKRIMKKFSDRTAAHRSVSETHLRTRVGIKEEKWRGRELAEREERSKRTHGHCLICKREICDQFVSDGGAKERCLLCGCPTLVHSFINDPDDLQKDRNEIKEELTNEGSLAHNEGPNGSLPFRNRMREKRIELSHLQSCRQCSPNCCPKFIWDILLPTYHCQKCNCLADCHVSFPMVQQRYLDLRDEELFGQEGESVVDAPLTNEKFLNGRVSSALEIALKEKSLRKSLSSFLGSHGYPNLVRCFVDLDRFRVVMSDVHLSKGGEISDSDDDLPALQIFAMELYYKYLARGSFEQVPFESDLANQILLRIVNCDITQDLFSDCAEDVHRVILNEFPFFYREQFLSLPHRSYDSSDLIPDGSQSLSSFMGNLTLPPPPPFSKSTVPLENRVDASLQEREAEPPEKRQLVGSRSGRKPIRNLTKF